MAAIKDHAAKHLTERINYHAKMKAQYDSQAHRDFVRRANKYLESCSTKEHVFFMDWLNSIESHADQAKIRELNTWLYENAPDWLEENASLIHYHLDRKAQREEKAMEIKS